MSGSPAPAAVQRQAAVWLDGVTYSYPGSPRPALADVDLRVGQGEVVVLAGPSGSGKSTLLRAISGLVPHFHGGTFAGRVTVCGMDTRDHGPGELAAMVGTVFQDPETQIVTGTVRSELELPLENLGREPAEIARAVEETALSLSMQRLLDRRTAQLSGGELARVALAAALVAAPAILVLDEPTSQLDPVAGDELIGLLRRANDDRDTTILLAEHRLERCLGLADRVLALEDGEIVCDAAPGEFLAWAAERAPSLQTPGGSLLCRLGLAPVPGVRAARAALRSHGLLPVRPPAQLAVRPPVAPPHAPARDRTGDRVAARRALRRLRRERTESALSLEGVWCELRGGPAILRDVSLTLAPGERVALMGANGAGKSTLLRHAAGLMVPSRGSVRASGRVALLLQHPNDYLVHETVSEEAHLQALEFAGLAGEPYAERHPRELSGGERQRLALAVVLGELRDPPAVLCLDEPTRGMDRQHRARLCELLRDLGCAVIVATHDPELAASFAQRVALLAGGELIADAPVREVLAGGSWFATETARILGGAGGALTPSEGAELLLRSPEACVR
ncbi:MAG TPA: ATP-binding cassette domain-containing protein [Solirubrobacteraceae bacterium]|nr:ATP-binding cassette domain-containing protein [Solirubrobacteraceae bacterium]